MTTPLGTEDVTPLEARLRAELRPEVEAEVRAELEPGALAARLEEKEVAIRALAVSFFLGGSLAVLVAAGVLGVAVRLFLFAAFR